MLRKLIQAGAILFLLTGAAYAQSGFPMPSISLGKDKPPPTPEEIERQKAIDNAYSAANKKIPDKQVPADPWGSVRPSQPAAKNNPNSAQAKNSANPPQGKNNATPPQSKNSQ
jgi:hypothetical protein